MWSTTVFLFLVWSPCPLISNFSRLNNAWRLQSAAINWGDNWGACHCNKAKVKCNGKGVEVRVHKEEGEEEMEESSHSKNELCLVQLSKVVSEASIFLWNISSFQTTSRGDGYNDTFSRSCLVIKMIPIDFGCLLFLTQAPTGAPAIVFKWKRAAI